MNGAQALIRTLVDCGVDVCFTNPGTSEMHFVAALDAVPEMRGVLGAVRGRRDRRGRRLRPHGRPPGGDAAAPRARARQRPRQPAQRAPGAHVPIVNIVGDHATYHQQFDAPLESDIETRRRATCRAGCASSQRPPTSARDAAEAVAAALGPPGQVATLILPADVSWLDGGEPAHARRRRRPRRRSPTTSSTPSAKVLRSGEPARCCSAARALRERGLVAASRIANATGAKLLVRDLPDPPRARRRACRPIERLGYLAEFTVAQLDGLPPPRARRRQGAGVVLRLPRQAERPRARRLRGARARRPAATTRSARSTQLADAVGAGRRATVAEPRAGPTGRPARSPPRRSPTRSARCCPRARSSPTRPTRAGLWAPGATAGAPRHDWLTLTGGAIGQGLPVATGAAVACPDRKVVCLEADGSAMYTLQSLWTQAREGLDVTTVILNNRSYAILNLELHRVGADSSRPARPSTCSTSPAPTSTSSRSPRAWASTATRATDRGRVRRRVRARPGRARPAPHRSRAAAAALTGTRESPATGSVSAIAQQEDTRTERVRFDELQAGLIDCLLEESTTAPNHNR